MEDLTAQDRPVLEGARQLDQAEFGLAVRDVLPGSLAADMDLLPGDLIESVNGLPVRDPIDFRFHFGEEQVELGVRRGEETLLFEIEKDPEDDLGVTFEDMPILKCDNKCVFCFLHQMPKKMRKTLYYQDDDYRLSFLHGAYVTLTNLSAEEFDRIVEQRLSPMYVSVHATDPDVRGRLLGRPGPVDVLGPIDYLTGHGIDVHTQVVYCPGINDGDELDRTIEDLASRYPNVRSLGVVPLGLTRFRQNLAALEPVTQRDASRAVEQIHAQQERLLERLGTRFVYAGDEFYLQRGEGVPGADRYDGFPLVENGIGMVRRFLDDFEAAFPGLTAIRPSGRITLVTGALGAGFVSPMAARMSEIDGLNVSVLPVRNDFLGHGITVSGLLAGEDIVRALKAVDPGDRVILPPNCVNHEGILLDDLTPSDIQREIGTAVEVGSYSLVETVAGLNAAETPDALPLDHPYIASRQNP